MSRIPYKISKFLFYTILVLFISWILLSFYSDLYAVDLTENEIIINKANTYQINLIPKNPKRFKYDNYIFESEDPQIAQVDKSGIVTAIKNGETNIIIRYKYGIKKVNLAISVSDVKISQIDTVSDIDLNVNETRKIDVKLNGKDNIITHLNYKSEDEDIAYVDSFGNVTGISEGYTYLIVSASGETQNKIRVNVRYVNEEIQEIGLEEKELTLRVGKEYKLNLLTIPRSANTSKVTWKSNNTNVVSVDGKGNVKAKKAGSATISVKINNLETACVINVVEDKVLVLNAYNEELEVGSEMVLSSNIESSFKSSDSDIASIDSNGNIKAKKTGTVTINVTSKTGLTNKCIIKVIPKKVEVSNIRIDKQIVNMNTGDTITLKPIIEPSNATNKNITYTSSNTSVISVDSDGRVVAKNAGKSIVTLRTNNGKVVSVTINVSVKNILPESIMFSKSKMDMYVGDYTYLQAITKPIDITNKVFEWSSSNSSIVTVNNFGMITAKKTGTSTISAKTENGLVAKIVINVIEKGKDNISIKLNEKELTLAVGKTKKLSYSVSGNIPKNETITWSSSDSNIVSVDKNGNIKALRSGYALIKVSVMDKYDSCLVEVKEEKVKTIKIEPSKAELKLGSSLKLNAIIEPSSATNKEVIWLSGDKNIATVDSTGRVTPKKAGTVTISAMSNNGIVASSTIKVVDITPTKITINQGDLELVEGDSTQLTVSYTPSNSTNKEIVFESATPNIAKVDSNGKVTAVSKGTTKISVYLSSNKSIKSEILVTVSSKNVNVESIVIDKVKANVYEGSVISLSAIIVPSNATDKTVTWKSSNSSIASVDSNGNVTGHKKGVVIITATTKNGKTSTSQITVISSKVEVESIRITSNVQSLYVGDTINMSYEVSPNNATDKSVIWSTSDETKASIDEMGRVTGLKDGVVYITVRSRSNTKLSFTKNIYIWNKVIPMNSITLNKSSIYLLANNSTQLLTTITPANATNKTIIWSSSNPRVASVDSNGVVTGLKSGTTTITASSIDETLKATCEVTVEEIIDVEKITLNKSSVTLNAGQEYQLIATVTPTNATNRTLTYSSNNASVASIDRNGKITALKEGNATITVSSADKKASTTCEIIVKKEEIKVNSISIKENISTMNVGEQKQLTVLFDPVNTTDKTLAWSSSDNSILTVSQSGLLNAKSEGTAKIWVCVKGSCDKTMLEKEITVKVGIKSIKINENISTMNVGEKKQLTITYDPTNATDKTLAWSSSDNSVLTVSQSGLLTAKGEGTAKIWVCVKGSCSKTMLEKEITVKIGVKSISITDDLSNINAGTSKKLNVVFTPSNATNKTLAWSSENTSVARISQDGVLTAVGEGTTKIWVFARDNYNGTIQSIDVSVKVGVKSISITDDLSNLKVGVTKKLNVTFTPSNATNKTLAWSSENTSVAKITQDGVLTAVGEGTTKIWVFAKDNYNGTIQSIDVNVTQSQTSIGVTKIKLNKDSLFLAQNTNSTLIPTISPTNATNKELTWTSSNTSIATVNSSGLVTAKAEGVATITATSKSNPNISASINVKVYPKSTYINYESSTLKYNVYQYSVTEAGAEYVTLVWVKDAYNQMKVALPTEGKTIKLPNALMADEINNQGYYSKGLFAINASIFTTNSSTIEEQGYTYFAAREYINQTVYENNPSKYSSNLIFSTYSWRPRMLMGLGKDGYMKSYFTNFERGQSNQVNEAKNEALLNSMRNDGIKYTFSSDHDPLLYDSSGNIRSKYYAQNGEDDDVVYRRSAICQMDKNNFAIITTTGYTLDKEEMAILFRNQFGCIWAANLDGGGSASAVYKKNNSSNVNILVNTKDNRAILDMLYFVEQ